MEINTNEIWKPIPNQPNYFASNLGNVKSTDKLVGHYGGGKALKKGKQLTPKIVSGGYLQVIMSTNNIHTHQLIHRLVALAFIPNPENKRCVNHINGIKIDNRVENLEWNTHKENNIHAARTGLSKTGEHHHRSKKVINTVTGIIYGNVRIASEAINMTAGNLTATLKGKRNTKTNLKYFDA